MSEVSASDIKKLRETTGAGMMDCKKALLVNKGQQQKALDWLRKNGLLKAAKKSQRQAAQGLVAVLVEGKKAAMIEVNSETDFVARNQKFQKLVAQIAKIALEKKADIEKINKTKIIDENITVEQKIKQEIAVIGENIVFRKAKFIETKKGVIAYYIHNAIKEQDNNLKAGKIAVLCAVSAKEDEENTKEVGKKLAMHIAAAQPIVIEKKQMDKQIIQKEENIYKETAIKAGKPENIIDRFVQGQMKKFYQQNVLIMQTHLVDGKKNVEQVLKESKDVKVEDFAFIKLGQASLEK